MKYSEYIRDNCKMKRVIGESFLDLPIEEIAEESRGLIKKLVGVRVKSFLGYGKIKVVNPATGDILVGYKGGYTEFYDKDESELELLWPHLHKK